MHRQELKVDIAGDNQCELVCGKMYNINKTF